MSEITRTNENSKTSTSMSIQVPVSGVLNALIVENRELHDALDKYKLELDKLNNTNRELTSQNNELILARDTLSLTIEKLQNENERLKRELSDIKGRLGVSERKVQNLENELSKEKSRTENLENEYKKTRKDLNYLMDDKIGGQLLGAAVDIINEEKIKVLGKSEWNHFRNQRNIRAHYLCKEDENTPFPDDEKYERYKLFIEAYENNEDLLVLDENNSINNKKAVSELLEKVKKIIEGKNIDINSARYLRIKRSWCL